MSERLWASEFDRIVVGVDFSLTGDHALREAMRLCRRLPGAELHVVHVIYVERSLHDGHRIDQLAHLLHARIDALRAHVGRVCRLRDGELPFTQETVFHVRLGEPSEALHQVAVDANADLIVVGTHAHRSDDRLHLGTTAEALIRIAHVPVLVARPKDFSGIARRQAAEPARAADDPRSGLSDRLQLEFLPRALHLSGPG